jgi:hypothetical protein
MKRILLAATAGAAVLVLGGTAVAFTVSESPAATSDLASVSDDPTSIPTSFPSEGPTASPTDEPTPGRTPEDRATAPRHKPAAKTGISAAHAKQIALARTGDARVVDIELEEEHGRIVWKVETSSGSGVTRVDVDASTGQVTRVRAELGSGGDDRRGDDGGGSDRGGQDDPAGGDD